MMSEQENKKQTVDMRKRILEAAGELMTLKGIKETSLKDIAKKVEISAGTLYYHYSAKEDIIYDIADENLTQIANGLLEWIDHVDAETTQEQILKTVLEKVVSAETRGKLHLYLISSAGIESSALRQKFVERYAQWRKTLVYSLDKVRKTGEASYIPMSYLIVALIDGLIIQNMFKDEPIPINDIVRLIVSME